MSSSMPSVNPTSSLELEGYSQTEIAQRSPLSPSSIHHEDNGPVDLVGTEDVVIQQLRPVDRGLPAWRVLIAATVFEAILWGFPTSFGVFQSYYSNLPQFANSNVALVGTIAQGLYYLGAPFSAAVTKRFPKNQQHLIWIGWPFCIFGLVAGSFTSTLGGLVATQGVMYGLGFVTVAYPIISMLHEWWIARKGMAFGLISCASGLAGIGMPFALEAMLQKYGYRTTLRASAVAMAIVTGPLIPVLKGRLPPAERSAVAKINWSFLRKHLFWIYCASTLIQGLGFFFAPVFLPSYSTAIGLSATKGALFLAILCIAQVLGQFTFAYLSDKKISISGLAITCSGISSVAIFALWGVAKSGAILIIFSLVYGFFGYGFGTMRVAMGRDVSDDPSATLATYSILVFLQGVGNVLVGPISAALLSGDVILDAYGVSGYKNLITFAGACVGASALVIGSRYLQPAVVQGIKFIRSTRQGRH